jgi:hypothetical protein
MAPEIDDLISGACRCLFGRDRRLRGIAPTLTLDCYGVEVPVLPGAGAGDPLTAGVLTAPAVVLLVAGALPPTVGVPDRLVWTETVPLNLVCALTRLPVVPRNSRVAAAFCFRTRLCSGVS